VLSADGSTEPDQKGKAMTTELRTSEQGTVIFDGAIVRDFLLKALGHDAVIDQVNELLFDQLMKSAYYTVDAESFKPLITEVLGAATYLDWEWVTRALTAEACETLEIENPLNRTPGAQPQKTRTRRALRNLDPGKLREKLAEIYTYEYQPLTAAHRARWIIRKIAQLTGISREQIQADAKADAEAIRVANDAGTATADQRSAPKDTDALNVDVNPPHAFVKYVSRDDARVLREKIEVSKILDTRRRAAIILASNVGVTAAQLAVLHEMDVLEVWKSSPSSTNEALHP
jgi:hypothetical protein